MTLYAAIAAGILGLVLGSFFNVVIHRLPRGDSLVHPGSHCPRCDAPVKPYDNVPVISWLILRGRCRHCGQPIPARDPLVEALTGALFAAVIVAKWPDRDVWLGLALVAALVPSAVIDLEHRIIPNAIMLPAALAAPAILALTRPEDLVEHLIAGAAAAGFLLVAALAYPRGMGMGDVKLAGVLGLYLGVSVAPAMLIALLAGTLVGAVVMARKGVSEGRKTAVPFGPFLALGGLVALFAGPAIVAWYADQAVLDFQSLGTVQTVDGERTRVALVAARRDMVARLLGALQAAGLRAVGIDLAAFAMVRALDAGGHDADDPILYVNVSGMTNVAIAQGAVRRFTRAVPGGMEGMVTQLAERTERAGGGRRRVGVHQQLHQLPQGRAGQGDPGGDRGGGPGQRAQALPRLRHPAREAPGRAGRAGRQPLRLGARNASARPRASVRCLAHLAQCLGSPGTDAGGGTGGNSLRSAINAPAVDLVGCASSQSRVSRSCRPCGA